MYISQNFIQTLLDNSSASIGGSYESPAPGGPLRKHYSIHPKKGRGKRTKTIYDSLWREGVKIEMKSGELGLSLDAPIEEYQKQITSGKKKWETLSKQVNTLAIYNKNNHPEVAEKARNIREKLAVWVAKMRERNPEFGMGGK